MTQAKVNLNSIDNIKIFIEAVQHIEADADLVSGRYVVQAKSLMGIFSLNLDKPIDLIIHAEGTEIDNFLKSLKEKNILVQ